MRNLMLMFFLLHYSFSVTANEEVSQPSVDEEKEEEVKTDIKILNSAMGRNQGKLLNIKNANEPPVHEANTSSGHPCANDLISPELDICEGWKSEQEDEDAEQEQ